MTDRELLELAARAAGYEYGIIHQRPHVRCDAGWTPWNPIDDDGAAFRLAVELGMCVICHATQVEYSKGNGQVGVVVEQAFRDSASTRRAIVRAAAEIGRSMIHNVEVRGEE